MADYKSCDKPDDSINPNIIISVDECYMIIKRALVDCMMSVRWLLDECKMIIRWM
jgi:hypothetical protein